MLAPRPLMKKLPHLNLVGGGASAVIERRRRVQVEP